MEKGVFDKLVKHRVDLTSSSFEDAVAYWKGRVNERKFIREVW